MARSRSLTFTQFCTRVLSLVLTDGQRVLCLVAFDGLAPCDLDPADRDLARTFFGDVETIDPGARRVLVLVLGRGSGKSTLSAAWALYRMLTSDLSACGPGDLPTVVAIAPRRITARVVVRIALSLAKASPGIARRLEAETADGFTLLRRDGRRVSFAVFSASRGGAAARGISIVSAILDESWFFMSDQPGAGSAAGSYVVTDKDIAAALTPRMVPGAQLILISTPWPVDSLTGELFAKNHGAPSTAVAALATTVQMRPSKAADVEFERQRDPDNAAREFDCDLRGLGSSSFFDAEDLRRATIEDMPAVTYAKGGASGAGVDLGLVRDSSALAIVGSVANVLTLHEIAEWRPSKSVPLKLSHVIGSIAEVMRRHHVSECVADAHAREPAREWATAEKIRILSRPEGDGAAQLWIRFRAALREGRVRMPLHARLVSQLRAVAAKPLPGGGVRIISPRRTGQGHGDIASAVVLAAFAASLGGSTQHKPRTLDIRPGGWEEQPIGVDGDPYTNPRELMAGLGPAGNPWNH